MNELSPPQVDPRRSERWETYLNADAANSWGERCAAVVTDISHQGLRLEGSRELVDIIFPNFKNTAVTCNNVVSLRVVLAEGIQLTDSNGVAISCRSIYVLREKLNWFQIGLCYQDLDDSAAARFEAFIVGLQG